MEYTVLGLFENRTDVEQMIERLRDEGFNPEEMSIVMRNREEAEEIESNTGADVVGGAASGATTGAIIGGLAGLVSAIAIPGIGAFFIGGPLAAALGLSGAAASTVSGAATGAVAGGLIGALTGLGLSEDEASEYENRIKEGAIFVAVPASDEDQERVKNIFSDYDASDIRVVSVSENAGISKRNRHFASEEEQSPYTYGMKGGKARRK